MAIDIWGVTNQDPVLLTTAAGSQANPAIADSGGEEYAVAWVDGTGTVSVTFYDEQGLINPARPATVVTDGVYGSTATAASVDHLQLAAGGAGIGYGVLWEEAAAGEPTILRFRYIGLAGTFGDEISVAAAAPGAATARRSHLELFQGRREWPARR